MLLILLRYKVRNYIMDISSSSFNNTVGLKECIAFIRELEFPSLRIVLEAALPKVYFMNY